MLESSWFVWVSQMNHIPMDIYYDQNLDWVSTQVKHVLNNCGHTGANPNNKKRNCCIALRVKPTGNWEVKINRIITRKILSYWNVPRRAKKLMKGPGNSICAAAEGTRVV